MARVNSASNVKATADILLAAKGLLSDSGPAQFYGTASTLATQTVQYCLLPLRGGMLISNVVIYVATAAAGAAPTTLQFGLYSGPLVRLAVSANEAGDVKYTTVGFKVIALTVPYLVPADGGFYVAPLQDGAYAGTPIQFGRTTTNADTALPGFLAITGNQTGQTSLPANGAITAGQGPCFWVGVS